MWGHNLRSHRRAACGAYLLGSAVLLAGCAGLGFGGGEADGPCLDDSQACVAERTGIVQSLSQDQTRAWVGQTAGRGTVASGVRLFAYQNVRDKLTCPELSSAITELDAAKQTLAEGPAPGQTMLRHNQIAAMTTDVRAEFANARTRKCGVASG
jgi:hypothetical protein